jgi:DNA-binding GntR family transcriptional regulator
MSNGSVPKSPGSHELDPLPEVLQLGTRVYQVILDGIVGGRIELGTQLRPDTIARQLDVSTTPVREALYRLESDGLLIKQPYQGWFVREFTVPEIKALYEFRSAMECFSVRLACERITEEERTWLRQHQETGKAALESGDMEAYRTYNRDLHGAILRAARNAHLSAVMAQIALQSELLMVKTIGLAGRPHRAFQEHGRLIELIAAGDAAAAEQLMAHHLRSALEDILRWNLGKAASEEQATAFSGGKSRRGDADLAALPRPATGGKRDLV